MASRKNPTQIIISPLTQIHIDRVLSNIRKELNTLVQNPEPPKEGTYRINCTFHFSKEYSIRDIAIHLLAHMESHGSGVKGKISKYGSNKFRCNLTFLWEEKDKAENFFLFGTLDEFIKGLISKGLSEQTIAEAASEICDNVDVTPENPI